MNAEKTKVERTTAEREREGAAARRPKKYVHILTARSGSTRRRGSSARRPRTVRRTGALLRRRDASSSSRPVPEVRQLQHRPCHRLLLGCHARAGGPRRRRLGALASSLTASARAETRTGPARSASSAVGSSPSMLEKPGPDVHRRPPPLNVAHLRELRGPLRAPLLRADVAQDAALRRERLVRRLDLREPRVRVRRVAHVGVVLLRQALVRALHRLRGRAGGVAQG